MSIKIKIFTFQNNFNKSYISVRFSYVALSILINLVRISTFAAVISTVFSPVTTAAISPEVS